MPAPAPIESSTTTQTISQVQISGCTAHCQDVSQVQVAVQESVTVQVAGSVAQSATALQTVPSPSASSQLMSSVTQIQIGCFSECFGTTTTNAPTAALTQQFLAYLNSLQPVCGSSTSEPTAATLDSVVDQVACQVQAAQTAATQTEVASQSATTVQVVGAAPASEPPTPPSVAQTQQGTWQLQIGCVFYCVDTQQVQQAQQSITIINVPGDPSGSNPGAIDVTDQIIWQVQVGCVAWCYDATQVQVVTGQSTVIVDETPAPASPPPPPPPTSPPPTSPPPTPAPDPPAPAQQTGPVAGQPTAGASASALVAGPPQTASPPVRKARLFGSVAAAGASLSVLTAPVARVTRVTRVPEATVAGAPAGTWYAPTVAVHLSIAAASHPHVRRSRHPAARPQVDRPARVAEALAAAPGAPNDVPVVALVLAAAVALLVLAAVWTQTSARSGR